MDNYLLDRDTLGKFIDDLMKRKNLPANSAEELNDLREKSMKALDDAVVQKIVTSLDEEQLVTLNQLLDTETDSPDVFRDFFQSNGINLEETITNAAQEFGAQFLEGGSNA